MYSWGAGGSEDAKTHKKDLGSFGFELLVHGCSLYVPKNREIRILAQRQYNSH